MRHDRPPAHRNPRKFRDVRREVAVPDPLAHVVGRVPSPHEEIEARALLKYLLLVEPRERRVLILVGAAETASDIARRLRLPVGTAFSRLRRGRLRLATVLKKWRRFR
ncbi:hypothetical protein [Sorangium atrum]|uniref:RNA polymerase sigma factor 70 region 4 type 2 domain-containing protein n=1 Tax=Sorangium atrum TaxID=2995308 RepID=A0ABT5BXX0_9BACT|nr:hypothetical protein [Sorangium aterium]MDC0679010.1 hypothetical protein [Sorangium aterium]